MTTDFERAEPSSGSPSPSLATTPVSSCFSSDRSFSAVSSTSTESSLSNASSLGTRSSSFSTTRRRRGYVRPQGATFAASAKNRDSVMSLGSIAHLQYYFARTGLLDGKGGQLAKKRDNGEYDIPRLSLSGSEVVDSHIEEEGQLLWEAAKEDGEDVMLPPTVSTYSHKTIYVPPPPDQKSMKKDLVDTLENALKALESCEHNVSETEEIPTQGFYEIQGLHILDTTTLAIRAARLYYTQHPNPAILNTIKTDYQIRKELYTVLEVLKKCAGRNFAGGIRSEERLSILVWVSEVGVMIDEEAKLEEAEREEREGWLWMNDSKWYGKEQERDVHFLKFLLKAATPGSTILPEYSRGTSENSHTEFLTALADGRSLVQAHNSAIKKSKKHFGQIPNFHNDIAKPYRRAENLRFWAKAAEIRWEIKLKLDVMGIANASSKPEIWKDFEAAIMQWSRVVREEVTKDWNGDEERKLHARAKSLALASPFGSPSRKRAVESNLDMETA